jgi:carbon monoxide dehydrogenase subunit G
MEGSITIRINRPAAEVFAYVADLEHAPDYVPSLVSMRKVSPGEIGVGSRYEEVVLMGGRRGDGTLEVTEYDPPRAFGHRGRGGPASFTARFTIEADGADACRLTHEYSVRLSGFSGKLIAPLVNRTVKSSSEDAVANLKRILETGTLD